MSGQTHLNLQDMGLSRRVTRPYFFPFPYELPDNLPFTQSLMFSALLTKYKIIKELGPHQRALVLFISI